jgi:hypothetical protein
MFESPARQRSQARISQNWNAGSIIMNSRIYTVAENFGPITGGVQVKRGRPRGEVKSKKDQPPIIVGKKGLYQWAKNPTRNWLGIVIERHIEKINWCLENCVSFTGIRVSHEWNRYKNLDPIFKNAAEKTFYGLRWPNVDENSKQK